ncbi:Glucose-1-phosphate adenylyltransferase large subunit 1 [Lathyrus oleraceus]|uniref:glucose-1-phosphate adenylyltransferase n=1 Tax=Pisum sativum TaxID=3888 RepID=A0A9D4W2Q6_PEA|nr:Glucose-1-phosphate adenylyltransferase large subunit 1 [Pisum sativum]
MLPRNPIARDTAELPSSSSPSSSAKTRPSSRKHKPSKENDPPSNHNIIVPYSPSHVKSKSPLPPRPPSSNPLKRKLALDTIAAENSLPATTDSGVKVIVRMRPLRKDKDLVRMRPLRKDKDKDLGWRSSIQNGLHGSCAVSCAAVGDSRASDFGLVKVDSRGRIIQFSEKPKGADLKAMQVDTSLFGLSPQDAIASPFIASMGVYVFKTDVLLKLLKWRYPTSNDFGSEIIPASVKEYNVQAFFFGDYWEDIGTIRSFYDANMALTEESPMFKFYDPKTPIFTSPRFLPPTKIDKCRIVDAIISHGCFLRECSVQHSIVGERSRLDYGVELKDTIMMGADYYQTESEIASELAEGKVPIGIGRNNKTRKCIIDKNARIGKDVIIMNKDGVQEADRPRDGFYIRSGITIVMEKATIEDGTII